MTPDMFWTFGYARNPPAPLLNRGASATLRTWLIAQIASTNCQTILVYWIAPVAERPSLYNLMGQSKWRSQEAKPYLSRRALSRLR